VSAKVLGRTNRQFPSVWLRLITTPSASQDTWETLAEAAKAAQTPLDISASPAFWGGLLRGDNGSELMQVSSTDYERATSSAHASDLVQAHLLETLSAVGRDGIDFYFLRSRGRVEENRLSGALEALEMARQEGHIKFLGLYAEGSEESTYSNWRLHDAFDVISLEGGSATLRSLASERRVGVLERVQSIDTPANSTSGAYLVPVGSAREVAEALEAAI
jgi:hypothetical protein